jgi:hypothetical protein
MRTQFSTMRRSLQIFWIWSFWAAIFRFYCSSKFLLQYRTFYEGTDKVDRRAELFTQYKFW